jgi:uncharacterized membrane protein YkoI
MSATCQVAWGMIQASEETGKLMILRFKLIAPAILVAAAVLLAAAPLRAEASGHDAVRHAVERGEIRALTDILTIVRGKLPGEVTGVEIERKNGRWLYEFRVVDGNGRLFEVYVDAKSGEIERIKEK